LIYFRISSPVGRQSRAMTSEILDAVEKYSIDKGKEPEKSRRMPSKAKGKKGKK